MYQAFLAIISLLAGAYCFWTKQVKMAFGFLIFAGAFFLLISNIAFGIKGDFLNAFALVLFIVGSFVIVWKKPAKKTEDAASETDKEENASEEHLTKS